MFKNVMVYRVSAEGALPLEAMEAALAAVPWVPCGPTQELSVGWVPPRGDAHGAFVELVGGQRILCFALESKSVPGAVVKRHLEERVAAIEAREGRKPGRREARELRDELVHELLPMAFGKTSRVMLWLDAREGRLVLDTGSQAKADQAITALVTAVPGLQVRPLDTQVAPQAAMTQWLMGGAEAWPEHLAPGREVELKSGDEMNSVVRFTRHHLDDAEMRRHIEQGKLPVKLGMDWDGRVSFVLTEGLQLRKLAFLDGVFEDNASAEDEGGFDADVAIATGELASLLTDLIRALGGELSPDEAPAVAQTAQ